MKYQPIFYTIPCIVGFILVLHLYIPDVEATTTTKYKILAIEYSESCQRMLDNHMNTTCPSLSKLVKYDTTNQAISGKFIISKGSITREKPEVKNHFMFYNYGNKTVVCVDCSLNGINGPDMIQIIFLEPSSFTYIDKDQEIKNSNSYITHTNPYISPDCITTTLGYTDDLLSDTIHYMINGCTGTHFINNQTKTIKSTPIDYSNSSWYKYQTWLKEVKKSISTQNCIIKKCETPNNKKSGW